MSYPNGWLIHIKQYLRRSGEQFEDYEQLFAETKSSSALYTAFGNFDRIEFVPIEHFNDYRSESTEDSGWYGKRQSIILYGLNNENNRFFQVAETVAETADHKNTRIHRLMEKDECGRLKEVESRFFIYTMMHISGAAKSFIEEYSRFLVLIEKKIQEITKIYQENKRTSQIAKNA